ncbi:MAG: pyridoxamine 5'-phosphate oxidase family protein [Methyloligellaceae bacterium]
MARAFTRFCFTPSVMEMQKEQGASGVTSSLLHDQADAFDILTKTEAEFIAARDGFYQSTVTETGWPYVQYRGGPTGFLKVIDNKTIAYADYSGNRQYLSDGNLRKNNRVSLLLMDYLNQRRLKIWGQVLLVDSREKPEIIAELHNADYKALPERAVIISIEAFDWNCPRHIHQRFTHAEIEPEIKKYKDEIEKLREENEILKKQLEQK